MLDAQAIITVYYSTPVILAQLLVCSLLWKQTRDGRTWGLLVFGSILSVISRYLVLLPLPFPAWIDDVFRASAISINTLGFFSLYFLLKKLIEDKKKS